MPVTYRTGSSGSKAARQGIASNSPAAGGPQLRGEAAKILPSQLPAEEKQTDISKKPYCIIHMSRYYVFTSLYPLNSTIKYLTGILHNL